MLTSIARKFTARPFGGFDPEGTLLGFQGALPRLANPRQVAIVIPIFNAAGELHTCLESLSTTTQRGTEVILVDDHSTDPQIGKVAARFSESWDATKTVRSTRNKGFVHSVNAGVAEVESHRDVVLLNSDTILTPGWLTKLQRAVSLRADIATANPLSNAAGVFSLPHQHRDNALPNGWTPAMCNRVLEDTSLRSYERVPATSGFCLYITRAALDAVGWFDHLLFKRGYGEENDFCERASAAGFSHVVDDGTFVFHRRAISFGAGKRSLKAQNGRVLKVLHPAHAKRLQEWQAQSGLGSLSASYAGALETLQSMEPGLASAALREPRTSVHVSLRTDRAGQGEASRPMSSERAIRVTFSDGYGEIDCFGIDTCRVPVHDGVRAGLVAWLANRWAAQHITLRPGVVEETEAQRLVAAFNGQ